MPNTKRKRVKRLRDEAVIRQGNRCFYCGEVFDEANLPTADHLLPKSKGGLETEANIVAACHPCNQDKGNIDLIEYLNGEDGGEVIG
jgi:5-methylcytosine-specific restriction endonuclease McrA